jgi:Na+/H+ antiporter NhaA
VVGVAAAAGIPFTVSIFVAELALPSGLLEAAKIGVLAAALLAGAIAYVLLRFPGSPPGSRQPAVDARGFPI